MLIRLSHLITEEEGGRKRALKKEGKKLTRRADRGIQE